MIVVRAAAGPPWIKAEAMDTKVRLGVDCRHPNDKRRRIGNLVADISPVPGARPLHRLRIETTDILIEHHAAEKPYAKAGAGKRSKRRRGVSMILQYQRRPEGRCRVGKRFHVVAAHDQLGPDMIVSVDDADFSKLFSECIYCIHDASYLICGNILLGLFGLSGSR